MSILQDLDPKYAKIHTQSSFAGWKSITWILSLLLILLWASWLVFTLQFDKSTSENKLTGDVIQGQGSIGPEVAKTPSISLPHTATSSLPDAPPAGSGTGSAIIQDIKQPEAKKSEKSLEPIPFPSIVSEAQKLTKSDQMTNGDTRNRGAHHQTKISTGHAIERKPAIKHANKASAEKTPQPGAKKAAERDIDIITAIVR